MKRLFCLFSLLMIFFSSPAIAKEIVIGFSQATLDSPFFVSLSQAAEAEAERRGAKLLYSDAHLEITKQNNDIMDFITKGVDILIINPVDPAGVAPALKAAAEAKIPVISVDRSITGDGVVTFVGRNNKLMGKEAGKIAVELLGGKGKAKGKIIELQGDAGGIVMKDRRDGFHEEVDAEPGLIVVQGPYSEYIRANAIKAFQDLYQANPDVNLVYAHNDDMALGALQVLKHNGNAGKVKIVGIDGLMEAVKLIAEGKGEYSATVMNDPIYLGTIAVDTAFKVLDGKTVAEFIDVGTGVITEKNAKVYVEDVSVFAAEKP